MPAIGLGTYRVFNVTGDAAEARCEAVVDAALEGGANLFDSSPMYGEAERVLAATLGDRRDAAIIATKVWARTRAIGEQQIEQALACFERIDIYQIHNLLAAADHLPFLHHLKNAQRVAAIGATHYLDSALSALIELMEAGEIDMVQIPYSVERRAVEAEVLPAAERLGIGVLVMEPLGKGRLLDRAPPPQALEPLADFGVHTWAQALLKWTLSDPRVHCLIPATSDPDHMRENIAAGSPPWFGAAERDYIARLFTS